MASSTCTVHSFSHPRVECVPTLSPSTNKTFSFPNQHSTTPLSFLARAAKSDSGANVRKEEKQQVLEEGEEEELPWIQEKALDLVEFTGSVTQAIPGPRVGRSCLPWILAVPLTYFGITFVIAFVKTVRKLSSPREKRRKLDDIVAPKLSPTAEIEKPELETLPAITNHHEACEILSRIASILCPEHF
ncbi:hypothetical protein K7X08_029824 [Anisodus acutangulus]|uniref:Transmembrane protein n=1 Tax=Anisodus acutangulus TaxID=402998 RepID=A0A9Q1M387_9SOLA|nr:hypothetical protein K7X08_029824 [Anisodus acutangulus]